jgi:hypothetical protein
LKTYDVWPQKKCSETSFYLAQDKLMNTAQNGVGFKSSLVILKTSSFTEDINQKGLHQENT